jgi:hypothetical protein
VVIEELEFLELGTLERWPMVFALKYVHPDLRAYVHH